MKNTLKTLGIGFAMAAPIIGFGPILLAIIFSEPLHWLMLYTLPAMLSFILVGSIFVMLSRSITSQETGNGETSPQSFSGRVTPLLLALLIITILVWVFFN